METTLLIDGDVVAYRAASAAQKIEEDGFGYIRPFANLMEGTAILDNLMLKTMEGLAATHVIVVLSDPTANWRNELMPDYKSNRDHSLVARPLLLGHLKEYLRARYGADHAAGLEADDLLGVLATEPQGYDGRRIVVGRDKDFASIPGLHHTLGDISPSGEFRVREVTVAGADRFHLIQALAGDRIDGYAGCPGLGMERAARVIDDPVILRPERGVITRGKNKGKETVKWVSERTADKWACIVSHYAKAGLTEEDALLTARVARILRHGEYDREAGRIVLWTPDRISY